MKTGTCGQCGNPCDPRVLRCRACWFISDKPSGVLVPLIDRFTLDERTSCWNWNGSLTNKGYGVAHYKNHRITAHRLSAHLWLRMPLDDKRCVLHHCDNPRCFNPKHLFIGTRSENMLDCSSKGRHGMSKRSACPKGHAYTPENTGRTFRGGRFCKICKRNSHKLHPVSSTEVIP